jgi:hypothetical protein
VGTYSITPSAATFSTGSAANYSTITYTAGSFSITRKALTVTPDTFTVTYGSTAPALTFTVSGLEYSDSMNSLSGYVPPTCSTTYTTNTQVAASPVAVTCSGGSATNYTFTSVSSNAITITRKALSISGTSIASRAFNGTTTPGVVTVGALTGLVNGEELAISTVAADYSSDAAGSYNTVVTYTLLNTSSGLANNYTLGSQTISGTITPVIPGFNIALSQGFTLDTFLTNYGNAETLTITATASDVAGTANFKVSINGGAQTNIPGCAAITITSGAAVCPWANPTAGRAQITVSLTPTSANQAVDPQSLDAIIVARPFITNFTVRNQNSKTGPAGSVVVITGGNFVGVTSIRFGTVEAEKTFRASATQATVTVPQGATTGKITITTLFGGSTTSADVFTVQP